MEFKSLIEKIKTVKPMQWLVLFVFLCVCVSMMLKDVETSVASQEEKRIAAILSAIEGAGKTEVALYYRQANDTQSVFSSGTAPASPIGAVIVSEGAGDITVRLSLIRAVRTLLGLSEDAVEVFTMDMPKKELLP